MLTFASNTKISPLGLRIFTRDFAPTLLSLRLPLKNWEYGLSYSSYKLPFVFDRLRFLNYRVEAKALDFSYDREQRKYVVSYDLGHKKHLTISSNHFMNFKKYFSFGRLIYERGTMLSFFKTLGQGSYLYLPHGSAKRNRILENYSWYLDSLAPVLRKRFSFHRKLRTQNFDLDLTVSSQNSSLGTIFLPLLPTRYNSFFASSFSHNRPLKFTARYFRYFYKYGLRKGFWSHKLNSFWGSLTCNFSNSRSYTSLFSASIFSSMFFFFNLRLLLKLTSNLKFLSNCFHYNDWSRFLMVCIFFISANISQRIIGVILALLLPTANPHSYIDGLWGEPGANNLIFSNKLLKRKYVVMKLAQSSKMLGRYSFYRPWRNRFAFSLRNYNFMSVYPQNKWIRKLNVSARKAFSKNVYKRDWFIYDSFHIEHRRARKLFGKFILLFFSKQNSSRQTLTKLPFLAKSFFKFSRRIFKGSSLGYSNFLNSLIDSKKLSLSSYSSGDSSHISLGLFRTNMAALTNKFAQGINNRRRQLRLSFLQKRTLKEGLHFAKTLRYFANTSNQLASKIKLSSAKWWRKYPLTQEIQPAQLFSTNFLLMKRLYLRGIVQMKVLVSSMSWRFSEEQVMDELLIFARRFLKGRLLRGKVGKKVWMPEFTFRSRLALGKFLRSQPSILKWFRHAWFAALKGWYDMGKNLIDYIVSLKKVNLPSLSYWFRLWNNLTSKYMVIQSFKLRRGYQWDFAYFSSPNSFQPDSPPINQRIFFLLNASKFTSNQGAVSPGFLRRRGLQDLPLRVRALLKIFAKEQLWLEKLLNEKIKKQALIAKARAIKKELAAQARAARKAASLLGDAKGKAGKLNSGPKIESAPLEPELPPSKRSIRRRKRKEALRLASLNSNPNT